MLPTLRKSVGLSGDTIHELQEILESAENGIVLTRRDSTILICNRSAREIITEDARSLVGCDMASLLPDAWEELKAVLETGTPQIARRVTIRDKAVISNRTPVVRAGQVVAVLSIFQELAEYEKVIRELEAYRHLSDELEVIINSSYDGLWICDHEGRVVRLNRASEKMSGVRQADVAGKPMQDLVDAGLFDKSATLEVLKHGTAVTLIQKLRDGRHILVTGNPVFDNAGKIRLVVVNARDISELNRLHAELEETRALTDEYRSVLARIHETEEIRSRMVVRSPLMKRVLDTAIRVARVDSSVLITGESGVGKGLLTRLIHGASLRRDNSLIHINCGAIPESLIEAELFGYEKGAFTGARRSGKPGQFELADGGTLFLDEIGELPLNLQVKLLRFLESGELIRIGATHPKQLDVRIIAATNRELTEMVAAGTFRKDLYYRLSVVPIAIPPLRERAEEIPPLIHHFLTRCNAKCGTRKSIAPEAVDRLRRYPFPGNIRELANLIEQLVVLSPTRRIRGRDIPRSLLAGDRDICEPPAENGWDLNALVRQVERERIEKALSFAGSQRKAARLLNINHSTLSRKIKRYGIQQDGATLHQGVE